MIYDRRIERLPGLAEVYRAKQVLEGYLPRTPLQHNLALSRELGFEAHLKLENLQPIGAFKVRGGVYLASTLSEEERARGIIGASTGNHGQSLAYGANLFGIRCVIAMPEEANPMKVESMRALGAEVEFHGANFEKARLWAEETARREGMRDRWRERGGRALPRREDAATELASDRRAGGGGAGSVPLLAGPGDSDGHNRDDGGGAGDGSGVLRRSEDVRRPDRRHGAGERR
jgi:hypothetical protein